MTASPEYDAAQAALAKQKDAWLGRLCWYTVPDRTVISHTTLVQHLVASNLSGFLPRIPSDIDKFRKVCTNAQQRKVPTTDPEVFDNYNLRELARNPTARNRVVRVLVRERLRADKIEYKTELCRITFTAPTRSEETGSLDIDFGVAPIDPAAQMIADTIRSTFNAVKGTLDGYGIRELFRRIIGTGAHGINVRGSGGGLYFSSEDFGHVVDNLGRLSALIPGTTVHYLPLIDDAKQREMVKRAYEAETIDEVEAVVNEIAKLRESGKPITANKVAGYMKHLEDLRGKTSEYIKLLGASQDMASSSVELFRRQIQSLMSLVG